MIILEKDEMKKLGISDADILKAQKRSDSKPLTKKVDENAKATSKLADALNNLANVSGDKGEVQDLSPVIEAIRTIQESQLNVLQLLEKKVTLSRDVDFTVIRNKAGGIHKIQAREAGK